MIELTLLEKKLVSEQDGEASFKKIVVFRDVERVRILSNPVAWRIMELLSKEAMYPAQVSKALKIHEQSAYYYIRRLVSIGAVEEAGQNFVRGGTARFYKVTSPSFGIEMDWGETKIAAGKTIEFQHANARRFFEEYVSKDSSFNGLLVVGAPDPHGPYKSSARDGHYAVHLAFFLGHITTAAPEEFVVKLDADAKAEKVLTDNLISIGGPGTNIVSAEFNRYLPIRFDEKNFWSGLVEEKTGKRYGLDNHGLIAKIRNPYESKSNVIVVAGVRSAGTKSAVIALTNYSEQVLKRYSGEEEWAMVVQGFDMNSDGKIDHVDVVSL